MQILLRNSSGFYTAINPQKVAHFCSRFCHGFIAHFKCERPLTLTKKSHPHDADIGVSAHGTDMLQIFLSGIVCGKSAVYYSRSKVDEI